MLPETDINIVQTLDRSQITTSKILDPWEDSFLMYYLKNGNYIPGSSQKQNKRIHKIASRYKLVNDELWYSLNRKISYYEYQNWKKEMS